MSLRHFIVSSMIVLSALLSQARAQTAEQLQLLQTQSDLAQQLRNQASSGGANDLQSGVPSADEVQTLNAQDAINDPSLLTQSVVPKPTDDSVVQKYYGILTGQSLPIYGAQEFAQTQDTQLLFFNTMGKEYRLAAGDVIRVTLRGLSESNDVYKIGRDGNLILPNLPPVAVSGSTILEIEQKILDTLQYDDASAAVFISLETARLITVQVSGAVKAPRTIAVPAYTPLSRVLAYAGGIKPTGSLRNIILRDRDGSVNSVDFYDFLRSPIGSDDPLVTDSSRVFVGNQGNTVAAFGFVGRPGIYELAEGQSEISVSDLLGLTGTNILPPGLEFEALYFDAAGITSKRKVSKTGTLQAGEVLDLRFVETRLQSSIRVVGAVLNEFEMASTTPIPLSTLLKNGTVLDRDALLDFALLAPQGNNPRAFNVKRKLNDLNFSIPPETTLYIFDKESFDRIVNLDPNTTSDPIVNLITQTDVAELYLNGKKIAFIPPSDDLSLTEVLHPFYRISPQTALELAIVEAGTGTTKAFNLQDALIDPKKFQISGGDQIHLFENEFLSINSELVFNVDGLLTREETANWKSLSKLFRRANVIKVRIDDRTIALVPSLSTDTLYDVLDILGLEQIDHLTDIGIVSKRDKWLRSQSTVIPLSSGMKTLLSDDIYKIQLFSIAYFNSLLSESNSPDYRILERQGVSIFIDYKLETVSSTNSFELATSPNRQRLKAPDLYPLFAIYEYYDGVNNFWKKRALSLKELSQENHSQLAEGARLLLFTTDYLQSMLAPVTVSDAEARVSILEESGLASGLNIVEDATDGLTVAQRDTSNSKMSLNGVQSSAPQSKMVSFERDLNFISAASRYISGAVERPGYYPISGNVNLSQFLSAAGGLTGIADITIIKIARQKIVSGRTRSDRIDVVNLTKTDPKTVELSGLYSLEIPSYIDDITTGIVTLAGEVHRPGKYIIARDDTLHDIIEKAGGLTDIAFPLGSVFTRESMKESQRQSNALLATQLEQSVLQVAQSSQDSVGEQVKSLLGYAQQLRAQRVSGRLSVNVLSRDVSAPIYLQPGDTLTIPKRPAHVSVIGSVQKDTIAGYSADKKLSAYLSVAGGLNRIADLKKIYILLPNGESIAATEESIIPPGAVIVVPPKTDRLTVLGLTDLVSRVLGNIASSVLAINNIK